MEKESKWEKKFRLDNPVGNLGLLLKTFRLFWKFSKWENQNRLAIHIPIEFFNSSTFNRIRKRLSG